MHITGELSAIFILSQIGFVVALIGIVLGTGGYSLLKVAFIPIAFLLFAIPLPYFIRLGSDLAAAACLVGAGGLLHQDV